MAKIGKRESARLERLYKDRQNLADLRKHFTGYDASDGFSLTPKKLYEIPYSQKRAMRAKHKKLQELLKKPFVDFVTPKNAIARKALRKFTGENMRNMKHFIVAKPSPETKISVVKGHVQSRTKLPAKWRSRNAITCFPKKRTVTSIC